MNQESPPTPAAAGGNSNTVPREFIDQFSLEMRTLLNDILVSAELMRSEVGGSSPNLDHILRAGRQLLKLSEALTHREPAPAAAPATPEPESATENPRRVVLYIEDNHANYLLVERVLKRRPFITLLNAARGAAGIELARQHRPEFILLDLNLPDMHGSDVLKQLLELPETANIPVVVVSADASSRQIERLLAAGARNYLTKPLDIERLLHTVDDVLQELDARAKA